MSAELKNLTKLSVNLIPSAVAAMESAAEVTGYSCTDTVNRALQVYDALVRQAAVGQGTLTFEALEGRQFHVTVFPVDRARKGWSLTAWWRR